MGLVVEEQVLEGQVEPKGFQVQEVQVKQVVEEEEGKHVDTVDPEPGRQLEDVQVDWDT